MAKSDTVDYKVKLAIDSKEYRAALRAANAEAKQFKKQQKDTFKTAGKDASDYSDKVASAMKKMLPAAALAAAYNVINKAMKENQSWTDEWARVTASARATYEGFVDSLVNGNFSGFFSNMREIISTARDAADALDALGTNKIFNSKELSQLRAEQAQLKYTLKLDNISAEKRTQTQQKLTANSQQQLDVTKSQANQSMQTAAALLVSELAKRGVNTSVEDNIAFNKESGFYEWKTGSMYDKYFGSLDKYNRWVNIYQEENAQRLGTGHWTPGGGMFSAGQFVEGLGNMSDEAYRELQAFVQVSDDTIKEIKQLATEADAAMTSYYTSQGENLEVMRRNPNTAGGGSGGGGNTSLPTPVGSIMEVEQLLSKAKDDYKRAMTDAAREAARVQVEELQMRLDKMQQIPKNNLGAVLTGDLANMQMPSAPLPELQFDKNLLNNLPAVDGSQSKSLNDYASALYAISDAFGSVSSAAGGAEDSLSSIANIAGSLTNVVTALLPLIALDGAKGLPFPGNVIAVTGFISAVLAAISTISNAKFASGGIVGGTSYRGDRLSANVNSGEMILNRIQQRRLFDAISSGSIGGSGGGAAVVRGEDIYVSLSNYMRRSGRRLL